MNEKIDNEKNNHISFKKNLDFDFICIDKKMERLINQLKIIQSDAISPYLASLHVLHTGDYPDRLNQFAYSLREVISVLCNTKTDLNVDQPDKNMMDKDHRIKSLLNVLYPKGYTTSDQNSKCEILIRTHYENLNQYLHHKKNITQDIAKETHDQILDILLELTKPQIHYIPNINQIMQNDPSTEKAIKLKNILHGIELYQYVLNNLDPSWIRHLYDAEYFWSYNVHLDYSCAQFIIKCIPKYSNIVIKCIQKYGDHTCDDNYYSVYHLFLYSLNRLPVEQTLKIVEKIVKENWAKYCYSYNVCDQYIEFALKLYTHNKYDESKKLLYMLIPIMNSYLNNSDKTYFLNEFLLFLNEESDYIQNIFKNELMKIFNKYYDSKKIPKHLLGIISENKKIDQTVIHDELLKFDLKDIIKILKSCQNDNKNKLKKYEKYNNSDLKHSFQNNIPYFIEHNSYEILEFLIKLITMDKNTDEDYYSLDANFSVSCIEQYKIAMTNIDSKHVAKLNDIIDMLQSINSDTSKELKYIIYQLQNKYFKTDIPKILNDEFKIGIKNKEYKNLLYSEFDKLNSSLKINILYMLDAYYDEKCNDDKRLYDLISAENIREQNMYFSLRPFSSHLPRDWKRDYESMLEIHGDDPTLDSRITVEKIPIPKPKTIFHAKKPDEVFDIMKKYKPIGHPHYYDETLVTFKDYVEKNHELCWEYASILYDADKQIPYVFLITIENIIKEKQFQKWSELFKFIKEVLNVEQSRIVIKQACYIIDYSLENKLIDKNYNDELFDIISNLVKFCNESDDFNQSFDQNIDTLNIARNDANGLSFHILFQYLQWCSGHPLNVKSIFQNEIKIIIDKYIDNKENHTISRHSVLGLYFNLLTYYDKFWSYNIIRRLFKSKNLKIAFWDSYILNNLTQDNMEHMYKLYSEFLNGAILNKYHDKGIYNRTIHHVALGYLHSLKHCKKMLITFIENPSNKNSIDVMCKSILEIVKSKNNKYKFENKLFDLWNNCIVIENGHLERWFDETHSDKDKSINLLLNYLTKSTKKIDFIDDTLKKLKKYIDMYPQKVIKCLKLLVEKIIYLPNEEIEEYLNDERLKNNSHIKSDYDDLVRILFDRDSHYGKFIHE